MSRKALAALLVMVVPLLSACNGGNGGTEVTLVCPSKEISEAPADLSTLSLENVYQRMAEAVTCPGHVLKVVTREEHQIVYPEYGEYSYTVTASNWIDLPTERARRETHKHMKGTATAEDDGETEERDLETVEIVVGDAVYRGEPTEDPPKVFEALVCRGSKSAVVSLLLGCWSYTEDSVTRFEPGVDYRDRQVPALITEGESYGSDETYVFTVTLYLDEDSLLPTFGVTKGTMDEDKPISGTSRYEYEFVPLESLAEDFFDPSAIGYVEADPEQKLRGADVGIVVYWLGRQFPGTGGLPALSLDSAYPHAAPPYLPAPRYRATIDYRLADERFGPSVVGLQLYPRAEWDAFLAQSQGRNLWDGDCVQKTEMNLGDRRAVIFGGYEVLRYGPQGCPEEPPDKWGAYIYIGDTVVLVDTSGYVVPGVKYVPSPYSSREGIEAIVRGLVPRPAD